MSSRVSSCDSSTRQAKRQYFQSALNARTRCDREEISYRDYRLERSEWLRRQGAKNVFRIINHHGEHVENLVPSRFSSPEAALKWVDELVDEDPENMTEWMNHPLAKLTTTDERVRTGA